MTTQNLPAVPNRRDITFPVPAHELVEVREQRKPWVAMGLILIAASAERMAAHLTGEEQALAYGTAVIAFSCAVVIGSRSRHRIMGKHLRRRFIAAVWGAAGWLTYVAACGMTWGATATLLAVGSLLSMLFWREHRIYGHAKTVRVRSTAEDNMFVARWKENLAAKGKKLAGSTLVMEKTIRSGYVFTVELIPGTHTVSLVQGLEASIRSGLRLLPGQQVIIEAHPDEPEPTAKLTVVTKSTIQVNQQWPGPEFAWDADRGSVVMGPFADGEGVALWSVYRKDGMFGGFIQGGIGSGKSRGIETIALACASSVSHPTTVWFACGQNGDSSPLLMDKADAVATSAEDLLEMLDAALEVGRINGLQNRTSKQRGFRPTPERPGLLIIVDEFHNFLDERQQGKLALTLQDRMVKIIREFRKAGVALLLATQEPLLPAFGHPSKADLMRANLLIGNGVMMRSETNNAKQVFKVDINARDFPDLPGYAYLARPFPGDRQAPFRFYFVDDDAIESWADSFTWRSLSPIQQNIVAQSAGRWYADRHTLDEARRREEERLLRELEDGIFTPHEEAVRVRTEETTGVKVTPGVSFGDGLPGVDEVTKFWENTPAAVHEPTAAERQVPLTPAQEAILAAVRRGITQPKDLIEKTPYASATVHQALSVLESRGLIQKPRTGRYVA